VMLPVVYAALSRLRTRFDAWRDADSASDAVAH
jgi:hypothetical protein